MQHEGKITKTDPGARYRRVLSASTLAGDQVQNSAGDDLGKVPRRENLWVTVKR